MRPPTLPRALDMPFAAPAIAGPAAEVTRDRPSAALVLYSAAVFLAVSAVFCAVEDSKRRAMAVLSGRGRRRSGRARAEDIVLCVFVCVCMGRKTTDDFGTRYSLTTTDCCFSLCFSGLFDGGGTVGRLWWRWSLARQLGRLMEVVMRNFSIRGGRGATQTGER